MNELLAIEIGNFSLDLYRRWGKLPWLWPAVAQDLHRYLLDWQREVESRKLSPETTLSKLGDNIAFLTPDRLNDYLACTTGYFLVRKEWISPAELMLNEAEQKDESDSKLP